MLSEWAEEKMRSPGALLVVYLLYLQFACFTRTKVQMLTRMRSPGGNNKVILVENPDRYVKFICFTGTKGYKY